MLEHISSFRKILHALKTAQDLGAKCVPKCLISSPPHGKKKKDMNLWFTSQTGFPPTLTHFQECCSKRRWHQYKCKEKWGKIIHCELSAPGFPKEAVLYLEPIDISTSCTELFRGRRWWPLKISRYRLLKPLAAHSSPTHLLWNDSKDPNSDFTPFCVYHYKR